MKKKKIVFCEKCESVMRPSKASLEKKETAKKSLDTHLDVNRGQKKSEFLLEVWKCSCPKRVCIIHLLE